MSVAARRGLSTCSSPSAMPTSPTMSGASSGPVILRLARAEPPDAMPLTKALSTRRSSAPATPTSTEGRAAVRSAPPLATIELPAAVHWKSSMRTRPFSSLRRVGTDCVNGTPARVTDAGSRTAVAWTRSSASRSASATTVAEAVPWISRNCSGGRTSFNSAAVMFTARTVTRAREGSVGRAFNHAERRDAGAIPCDGA